MRALDWFMFRVMLECTSEHIRRMFSMALTVLKDAIWYNNWQEAQFDVFFGEVCTRFGGRVTWQQQDLHLAYFVFGLVLHTVPQQASKASKWFDALVQSGSTPDAVTFSVLTMATAMNWEMGLIEGEQRGQGTSGNRRARSNIPPSILWGTLVNASAKVGDYARPALTDVDPRWHLLPRVLALFDKVQSNGWMSCRTSARKLAWSWWIAPWLSQQCGWTDK